ncbi:MAG: HAD family hydrolase [Candidatus Hodarchaeota archaeon]
MKWQLIASDLDGTLIQTRSAWERVHERLGTWQTKGKKYLEMFLAGEIDYITFCKLDAATWKGTPLTRIHEIAKMEPFLPTVKSTIPILKKMTSNFYIVSAGLQPFANYVVNELSLDGAIANDLNVDENGILTGDPIINLEWDEKDKILKKLCTDLEIDLSTTIAIGDGLADIPMFDIAGLSIAVNADLPDVLSSAMFSVKKFAEIPKILKKI